MLVSATEQDDGRTSETDQGAGEIPPVRLAAFDKPEPAQRCGDVDPAIGSVSPPSRIDIDQRQAPGEHKQRRDARKQPPHGLRQAEVSPEREASRDLGERRHDVGQGGQWWPLGPCP